MSSPAWSESELKSNPHQHAHKAEKVRGMFAAIAPSYDLNNRVHSFGRDVAWRNAAVRLSGVKPGEDVLDVACGTGDLTRAFAAVNPRRVVGLDFTPQMLDIACAKSGVARGLRSNEVPGTSAANRSVTARVLPEYLDGDAMNLPFSDGSFDVVSIAFGLRNVGDPAKALREFRRVLRSGGRVVVLEFDRPRNGLIAWANDLYTSKIMPLTATLISRDTSGAYKYLPKSVETFLTREQLGVAMREAGFSGVKQTAMTFGVCVCSVGVC
jgi:demethylmenaquinone methyltransferase/2-methoxy-6-polyprenyl-1,4-benzoquinol methylase